MRNIGLACVIGILSVIANSSVVKALDFNFSFEGTGINPDDIFDRNHPGKVTGLIQGLKDNAQSRPSKIIINENNWGIPIGTVLSFKGNTFRNFNVFTVKNGKIIDVEDVIYRGPEIDYQTPYRIYFNESTRGINAVSNSWAVLKNYGGFSGVKYTPVSTSPVQYNDCNLIQVKLSAMTNNAVIDKSFEPSLVKVNNYAVQSKVKLLITSSFRFPATPLAATVVNPAKSSNHLVGHAIDINLYYLNNGKQIPCTFGGGCLKKNLADMPAPVKKFFTQIVSDKSLRWGGLFQTTSYDPVHIDSGLNIKNPIQWKETLKTTAESSSCKSQFSGT
jgi:hypothetical protein